MSRRHTIVRHRDGLDDIGALAMPFRWRMDARSILNRPLPPRPWHDEELTVPLEVVEVDPERVLYWDREPTRENSPKRIAYMLASRAVPTVVKGGNTMRNVTGMLDNLETAGVAGYAMSRIMLARRVLAHLSTKAEERKGHYRSSNLQVVFRYKPPQGEAFDALVDTLREMEGK